MKQALTCPRCSYHSIKLHAKVTPFAFRVLCLISHLYTYRTAQSLYNKMYSLQCCDGLHSCDVTLLVSHLLCPEPPPGTTTVYCWYRVHCLVYLMCGSVELFWCVDVIISVSILH